MGELHPPLVWVDFNDALATDWVAVRTGAGSDLSRLGVEPREGVRVRVYDNDAMGDRSRDNLVGEGVLARWPAVDHYRGIWMVHLDYLAHESDFDGRVEHWCHAIDWDEEERVRATWFGEHKSDRSK
jgi:hypothetical protein